MSSAYVFAMVFLIKSVICSCSGEVQERTAGSVGGVQETSSQPCGRVRNQGPVHVDHLHGGGPGEHQQHPRPDGGSQETGAGYQEGTQHLQDRPAPLQGDRKPGEGGSN